MLFMPIFDCVAVLDGLKMRIPGFIFHTENRIPINFINFPWYRNGT